MSSTQAVSSKQALSEEVCCLLKKIPELNSEAMIGDEIKADEIKRICYVVGPIFKEATEKKKIACVTRELRRIIEGRVLNFRLFEEPLSREDQLRGEVYKVLLTTLTPRHEYILNSFFQIYLGNANPLILDNEMKLDEKIASANVRECLKLKEAILRDINSDSIHPEAIDVRSARAALQKKLEAVCKKIDENLGYKNHTYYQTLYYLGISAETYQKFDCDRIQKEVTERCYQKLLSEDPHCVFSWYWVGLNEAFPCLVDLGVDFNARPFLSEVIRRFRSEEMVLIFIQGLRKAGLFPKEEEDHRKAILLAMDKRYIQVIDELGKEATIKPLFGQIDPHIWQSYFKNHIVMEKYNFSMLNIILKLAVDHHIAVDFNEISIPLLLPFKTARLLNYICRSICEDKSNRNWAAVECICSIIVKIQPTDAQLNMALRAVLQAAKYALHSDFTSSRYIGPIHLLLQKCDQFEIDFVSQAVAEYVRGGISSWMHYGWRARTFIEKNEQLKEIVEKITKEQTALTNSGKDVVHFVFHFFKVGHLRKFELFIKWANDNNIFIDYNLVSKILNKPVSIFDYLIDEMEEDGKRSLSKRFHSLDDYREVITTLIKSGGTFIQDLTAYKRVVVESRLNLTSGAKDKLEEIKKIITFFKGFQNAPHLIIPITELKIGSFSLLDWVLLQITQKVTDLAALTTYLLENTEFGKEEQRTIVNEAMKRIEIYLSPGVCGLKYETEAKEVLGALSTFIQGQQTDAKDEEVRKMALQQEVTKFVKAISSQLYTISEEEAFRLIEEMKGKFAEENSKRESVLYFTKALVDKWLKDVISQHQKERDELSQIVIPIITNYEFFRLTSDQIAEVLCQLVTWNDYGVVEKIINALPVERQKEVLQYKHYGQTAFEIAHGKQYKHIQELLQEQMNKFDESRSQTIESARQKMESASDAQYERAL